MNDPGRVVGETRVVLTESQLQPDIPLNFEITLPISNLREGRYRVIFDLLDGNGSWLVAPKVDEASRSYLIEVPNTPSELSTHATITEKKLTFTDQKFWLRYSEPCAQSELGIIPIAWQKYSFLTPSGQYTTRSMLSLYELSLLYALGRHYYTGDGAIIDAGPLLGASTYAFARGVSDNKLIEEKKNKLSREFIEDNKQKYNSC
jgi:hypothetical protein